MKTKKIFKNWKVILLLFCLIMSFLIIDHQFSVEGVAIKSVEANSTAFKAGIENPEINSQPTKKELILEVNGEKVNSLDEYSEAIDTKEDIITIKTNKAEYKILNKGELGLTVDKPATSNIRKGLELQGGTRVLLKPKSKVSDQDVKDIIDTMQNRLNIYGLSDLKIKAASDLSGNKFILVEIAGATKEEVKELVSKQGKFEAKIGDELVFEGGKKDVTFVCRHDGTCSRIVDCNPTEDQSYFCRFEFEITLSSEAAKRHARVTDELSINITESGSRVLSKTIDFYLDGTQVDSLQVAADLKGQEATRIVISGPGRGQDQSEAIQDAIKSRDKLQTVLITGSLPTELEIVKLDSISPSLGEAFLKNAMFVGLLAILAVFIVILIRFRSFKIAIPMLITVASEVYIILGLAALFRYNLDLAAIAGIIASVGTGVDDQIVITDEVRSQEHTYTNWKQRIKKAFFIIMIAYATTVAAMLPLLKAGAGLLTGFALVTIAGVTIGVLITRPAFASIIKILLEE